MAEKLKQFAPTVVRIGVAIVFLWFGAEQLMNASDWIGWLPNYARSLSVNPETLVYINGTFETALGVFLLAGLYTRTVASLLAIHMAHIITIVGYGEIGVRDFGIFTAALSVALHGTDDFSLDRFFLRKGKDQNQ